MFIRAPLNWAPLAALIVLLAPVAALADSEGLPEPSSPAVAPDSDTSVKVEPADNVPEPAQDDTPSTVTAPAERRGAVITNDGSDDSIPKSSRRKPAAQHPSASAMDAAPAFATNGGHRIQLFLIPIGEDGGALAPPVQAGLEAEVNRIHGYHPVDLVEELAAPTPPDVLKAVTDARKIVEDGNNQFLEHQYMVAVDRYKQALKMLSDAALGTSSTELADVTTRQAIALQYAGEDDGARDAFRAAARLDLAQKVDGTKIDSDVGQGLNKARREIAKSGDGTLSVISTPPGSRVFVGGVYRGATPVTIEHLPIGLQYVKVDRPGADIVARLVDVKPADGTALNLKMNFSKETVDLQSTLQQIPLVLDRERGIPGIARGLAGRFKLDRLIIATVQRIRNDRAEVRAVVFDLPTDTRMTDEHAVFGTDPDSLKTDAGKWGHDVFNRSGGSKSSSSNSISHADGTEDFYANQYHPKAEGESPAATPATETSTASAASGDYGAEDPPPDPKPKKKKSKSSKAGGPRKDPLDGVDGTEDW